MILAISNNKGGTLKSTATVNIASILYNQGKKILVVDSDNQGNAALSFGINPDELKPTLYEALTEREHVTDCIYTIADNDGEACLDILPANDDMALFDYEMLTNPHRIEERFGIMKRILAPLRAYYDVILVDTPPNIALTVGNVLTAADGVLVPFQPERYSMRSLVKILKAVRMFRSNYNRELDFVGMFPVLVDGRSKSHPLIIEEARKYSDEEGFTMFETTIPRSLRFVNALTFEEKPLAFLDPDDPLSALYADLWAEIEEKTAARA